MFKRSEMDTDKFIEDYANSNFLGLKGLIGGNRHDVIVNCLPKIKKRIERIDQLMTDLISKQEQSLALMIPWSERVSILNEKVSKISNCVFGLEPWDWLEVIKAMSLIEAICIGAKSTLRQNGVEPD